jgi:hypothetical protein
VQKDHGNTASSHPCMENHDKLLYFDYR